MTILISPMFSHPGPDKNHMNLMHGCIESRISKSSSEVGFYSRLHQKMMSVYADVNVKNRRVVAGSISIFKLFKRKDVTLYQVLL